MLSSFYYQRRHPSRRPILRASVCVRTYLFFTSRSPRNPQFPFHEDDCQHMLYRCVVFCSAPWLYHGMLADRRPFAHRLKSIAPARTYMFFFGFVSRPTHIPSSDGPNAIARNGIIALSASSTNMERYLQETTTTTML